MLIQAGIFGLGPNSSLNQWTGRDDVSIQLMWQLENFGLRQPGADQASSGASSRRPSSTSSGPRTWWRPT